MSYVRVLPRDLFNEAKLLRELAFLTLMHHDGQTGNLEYEHDEPEEGFNIALDMETGVLCVTNLKFSVGEEEVFLGTNYNSRSEHPLHFACGEVDGFVFESEKVFTPEFRELVGLSS